MDIALAQVAEGSRPDNTALIKLLALATDSERRHFIAWTLEAKLAAWRLMRAKGLGGSDALHTDIEKMSRQYGFARIARLLQEQGPTGP